MRLWQLAILGFAILAIAGCRSDPAIPILERELRLKDDEIYRLRGMMDDMQDSPQAQPVRGPRLSEPQGAAPRGRSSTIPEPPGAQPPNIELPGRRSSGVPDALRSPGGLPATIPEVPEGIQGPSKPLGPGGSRPASDRSAPPSAGTEGPMLERGEIGSRPRGLTMASRASVEPFTPSGDSRNVAAIVINRSLTGGIGAADSPGDQGLSVVVEPRDRAGRSVDAPADMSVVVLDPALQGEAARVARWDFSAAETAGMFRRSGSARAIHLAMTWPGEPPAHHKLQLYVRYVTADGRKLNTDQAIEVALPGDKTARWKSGDFAPPLPDAAAAPSWRQNEQPPAESSAPPLQVANRPDDLQSRRPVWSPERR